jgi:asparagine synthase (glutamine-hydrolysing)
MCGIFGYIKKDKKEIDKNLIEKEFMRGISRGPENSQLIRIGEDYLGFHRLAINGLDEKSNQPILIDEIYLICNGEIYNYKKLYNVLGVDSKTNSDCEIIIHMYKKYGIEYTLRNLDGVFGFILYDKRKEEIYIGRDILGVRPVYCGESEGCYVFGSELKQICNISDRSNCRQLNPGTYMRISKGENSERNIILKEGRYFDLEMILTNYFIDEKNDYYERIVYENLYDAVKKRVDNTERPIACLLSGGLDSSLITALVCKILGKDRTRELETYSIGLEGGEDLHYAKKVADYLGTKHKSIIVSEEDFINAIPEVIRIVETYDTTTIRASVGNYLLGKYISENSDAKVIFNGDGSDELTGGYLYFHYSPNDKEFDEECKRLLKDIHNYDVLRSDKCISSNGLEPRTPFLDRSLICSYLSIPANIRNHCNGERMEKSLLRSSIERYSEDLLPKEILWRRKEAFSDGVSNIKRSWYEIIGERVREMYKDEDIKMDYNEPRTKEQLYYRRIFEEYYEGCEKIIPYYWLPRFCEASDASARTLKIYK